MFSPLLVTLISLAFPTTIQARVEQIASARASLSRYHVSGSIHRTDDRTGQVLEALQFVLWRDGETYRFDRTRIAHPEPGAKIELGHRYVMCLNCIDRKTHAVTLDGVTSLVMTKGDVNKDSNASFIVASLPLVHLVGFSRSLTVGETPQFNQTIVPGNDLFVSYTADTLLAKHKRFDGITKTYHLQDGNIQRVQTRSVVGKGEAVTTLTNTYRVPNDYFFPDEVVVKGALISGERQTTTMKFVYHSLNKPIDPSVFSLPGMNIKDGTSVTTHQPEKEPLFVVGGKIVPYNKLPEKTLQVFEDLQAQVAEPPRPARSPWRFTALYAFLSVVLAVAAVILLRRIVRKT